jgi:hypothetical protein
MENKDSPPSRNKPALNPATAPVPTAKPAPPPTFKPALAAPAPTQATTPAARPAAPAAQPAKGPATAKPEAAPDAMAKVKAFYDRVFPVDSPQRKSGPFIVIAVVIIVLLLAKCAVSSVGEKISAATQVRAEEKRIQSTGVLVVKSNWPEATVEATLSATTDHPAPESVKGVLGQPLPRLAPGKYAVTLHADGWPDAHSEVDVPAGQQTEVTINFKSGSLRLDSDPTGATVKLGNAVLGKTPLVIPRLPPGPCALSFEYPSWPAVSLKVAVTENVESAETVRLPHGSLTVETFPAGATVLVGGKNVGKTPLTLENVPAGEKKIKVQAADYPALDVKAVVEDRGEAKLSLQLGAYFPALDPEALFRGIWVPDDPNRIAPPDDTTGPYQSQNGIVKNLNRKRLHQSWLNKRYHFSAVVKAYDAASGKLEFVEQENAFSKYRVTAVLTPEARKDPALVAPLAKGATRTLSLYGLLTAVEEPRWPSKVIRFEISAADLLH